MKAATRQIHHHHHQQEAANSIYLILGVILILPLLWPIIGSDQIKKWHPFYDVEYSLYWYVALTIYNIKPFLYLIVARLYKPKHKILLIIFMGYEGVLFLDHILIYSQSPGIFYCGIILSFYMVLHHYKYE